MHGILHHSKNEQIMATHNCTDESTDTVFTEDSRCRAAHITAAICLQFRSVVAGLAGRAWSLWRVGGGSHCRGGSILPVVGCALIWVLCEAGYTRTSVLRFTLKIRVLCCTEVIPK